MKWRTAVSCGLALQARLPSESLTCETMSVIPKLDEYLIVVHSVLVAGVKAR